MSDFHDKAAQILEANIKVVVEHAAGALSKTTIDFGDSLAQFETLKNEAVELTEAETKIFEIEGSLNLDLNDADRRLVTKRLEIWKSNLAELNAQKGREAKA